MNKTNENSSLWSLQKIDDSWWKLKAPTVALYFYKNKTKDILTGVEFPGGLTELEKKLSSYDLKTHVGGAVVFHAFYELGHLWVGSDILDDQTILGVWLEYEEVIESESLPIKNCTGEIEDIKLPNREQYEESFTKGVSHLMRGDCYQFNLTFPVGMSLHNELGVLSSLWAHSGNQGAFAHYTSLKDRYLISNSPESLFQLVKTEEEYFIDSKPIKGTMPTSGFNEAEVWKNLKESEKNESELFMITDLLRNDMYGIEERHVEVLAKKEKLLVPGLVHSYSHLRTKVKGQTSLLRVFKALFPGGSITGAPKKRVMEIIKTIEVKDRGYYCGSTLVMMGNLKQASINIRSGQGSRDTSEFEYWSGGGITVESDLNQEFQELLDKLNSFVRPILEGKNT